METREALENNRAGTTNTIQFNYVYFLYFMFTLNHNDVKITIMVKWVNKINFFRRIVISYFICTIALSYKIALLLQQRMVRIVVQVVVALASADDCSTVAGRWMFAFISSAAGCWGWFVLSTDYGKLYFDA